MDGITEDMWTPYKHLYATLQQAIAQPKDHIGELEQCLKKYKHNFANFLRNPPKNEKSRNQLKAAINEGIPLGAQGHKLILSHNLVDEAIICSDMFDLDELFAVELLYTAQRQQMHHSGLTRGLVAVLLYYDGRKAMACALRDMMQTISGVSWMTELPSEFLTLINNYVQNLTEESNLLGRLLDILAEMDVAKENLMLTKNRAYGSTKHQNQVLSLYEEIRKAVAMSLFNYSAQRGLPRGKAIRLMKMMAGCKCNESGNIDDVTVIMLMALLYSYDTSVLLVTDVDSPYTARLPIMWDPEFAKGFYEALYAQDKWETPRLDAIIKYSFALALASLRHAPSQLQAPASALISSDEQLMDEALAANVFGFIYRQLLENETIYNTEFIYRRAHLLITDFIDFMHAKVAELRNRADESARTVISFLNEGLEPPTNVDGNYELLMLCVARLYGDRRASHSLCNEYWGASDTGATALGSGSNDTGSGGGGGLFATTNSSRAVSLFKFISLASELLPPTLFQSYLKMITGLTRTELAARSAFNLLKNTPSSASSYSMGWDHFFQALANYYSNMRTDASSLLASSNAPNGDHFMRRGLQPRNIAPRETEHLVAVMGIMRAVAEHDRVSRVMMCDQSSWQAPQVLIGLVACATPLVLKAEIMFTLAALARSKATARAIWFQLEDSQIIPTLTMYTTASASAMAMAGQSQCSLAEEIEQNESRLQSYNLSRGVLQLLHTLMTTHMPRSLGAGTRRPGYYPYLKFLMDSILLKFYTRSYKDPSEMWEVGAKGLKLLFYLLATYRPKASDFLEQRDEHPYPGYHVMLELQVTSDLLRLLLRIIEDARERLDEYRRFRGKEQLEECALYALLLLEVALAKQNAFFEAHSSASSPIMLSGLNRMLLDFNPRTRRPDYVLKIIKFVTYNNWLPRHSLAAIKILTAVTMLPNVASQILNMYPLSGNEQFEVRQGFVECLEMDARLAQQNEEQLDAIVLNDYQAMGDVLNHGGQQPPSAAVDDDESESEAALVQDADNTLGPCYEVVALNERIPVSIDLQIKEAVVQLFGLNICQAPPNFVYFLLGIDVLRDFMARDKQQIGIEMQCCCVHSLVLVLETYLESQKHSQNYCPHTAHLVESIYQLFHGLCANRRTSETILRFFRLTCNDFLLRHLNAMPFRRHREDHMMHAMSHLLNCVAVEVRLAANHGQITRYNLLCDILLLGGQSDGQRTNPGMPQDLNNSILSGTAASSSFFGLDVGPAAAAVKMPDKTQGLHANRLLECLSLEEPTITPQPQLEFFDPVLMTKLLSECESQPSAGSEIAGRSVPGSGSGSYKMINVRKLHDILHEELRTVQSTIATGQRKAISSEITVLLQYAVEQNRLRTQRMATLKFVDAWCQLVQVLFSSMPEALLPPALRRQYIIDIIEKMLLKVEPVQPHIAISIQITETILLLLANLRVCYYQLEDQRPGDNADVTTATPGSQGALNNNNNNNASDALSQSKMQSGMLTGSTSNLRFILKRIVEWIMVDGVQSQKLRINLYTALLTCLRIVKRLRTDEEVDFHESIASRLEKSLQVSVDSQRHEDNDRLKEMASEVIAVYGEKLIDSICYDAVTGHNVCRLLALACLEMISELYAVSTLTEFVVSRGYLKHLLDSLAESDDALSAILQPQPESLRELYVYEARLAFLTRLSQTQSGARMMLAEGTLGVLSNMRVFDLQPDLKANQLRKSPEGFLPSMSKSFHDILQPALVLCDAIVTSMGSQNNSAALQVLNFLFAHIDMVETMLRSATPLMELEHLEQLASITNLFSRTSTPQLCTDLDDSQDMSSDLELHNRLNRLQQLMIVVFGRFTVTESTIRQILKQPHVESLPESQKSRHIKYFLDIAANLSLYCRHAVTSHVRDSITSKFLLTTIVNDVTPLTGKTDGKKLTAIMHTIIEQLKGSVGYYLLQKSHADNLLHQRSSLPNICFGPSGKESYVELSQRHSEKRNELMQAVFIAEQNLYLLWIHLDFYMRNAVIFASENRSAINESNLESFSGNNSVSVLHATPDELLQLKQHLISTFNETFCSELIAASEEHTVKCKGFNGSLLRRIKALVQFAASNGNANDKSFI